MEYLFCITYADEKKILLVRDKKMKKDAGSFIPSDLSDKHKIKDIIVLSSDNNNLKAESFTHLATDSFLIKLRQLSLDEVDKNFEWEEGKL